MTILPYLETFAAVVDNGSFTAAAQALGVSKPVVSKQVALLEKHLGVQLLHRTTRRLHLTQAGEMFVVHARKIMSDVHEAEQSIVPLQSEPQGRLRISAPESLAMFLLAEALPAFQEKYPKLELDIRITGRFVDLVEEGIDVALRVGELQDSSLMARRLMSCRFHVCASAGYLQRYGRPTNPDELAGHNCLIYSQGQNPDSWFFQDEQRKGINVKVKGGLHSENGNILLSAALDGIGILRAPTFMVSNALKQGQLETLLDDYMPTSTGLYAVFPNTKFVSQKVRTLVDYLVEAWSHDETA
ncbi:LysR family transcriptional regulator [Halomonas nitroreducens]|uniref:LysR family transcriptional regulator n=1 Tax=Halomonas nitroreducens TaxID=447425 RepID=A0A3S0HPQ6_9GAMM|nr:LysR family transcriptional regulator [Halomonas nitroreducens]RTQ98357.1 LysR family transcriptional regulator [Halomonas nitroreducens]